jgi:N4-gp56 family major capsid protein
MGPITPDSTTTYANLIPQWYSRQLLNVYETNSRFYGFAEKTPLPTGEGKTVTWNRFDKLGEGYVLTEGVTPSNQALATTKVSALVRQFGQVVAFTDFADLTTINDMGKQAIERLGQAAARTLDDVIQQEIITHTQPGSVVFYVKQSAQQYYSTAASAAKHVSGAAAMAVSDIRTVAFRLRAYDVPPIQGTDYIAVTSPQVVEKLEADTAWTNYHQYVEKGIDNIYSGEVGRIFGTRFFTTTNIRVSAGSTDGVGVDAASAGRGEGVVHATFVFGKQFYGVTELDGGLKYYSATGSTKSDILDQTNLYGWKANFIAHVLNVSAGVVMWTGVDTAVLGCLVSARKAAGLNSYYPDTST